MNLNVMKTIKESTNAMCQSNYIACDHCDLLLAPPQLTPRQCARCPRCGHKISRLRSHLPAQLAAYGITALILLALSNAFSVLTFNLGGNISNITLWQSALNMYFEQYKVLSIIVFIVIVVIPAIVVMLVLSYLAFIKLGLRYRALSNVLRLLFGLLPWAMAEVFLVGVLVSLVKLVSIAQMQLGWSFWAYTLFCLCYVKMLSMLDRYQLWSWLEQEQTHDAV